jgi:uncharacterized lipoprotein YddW (UPF0748 family)
MTNNLKKWCADLFRWKPNLDKKQQWVACLIALGMALAIVSGQILSYPTYAQNIFKPSQTAELRGVWLTNVDSNVLFGSSQLKTALRRLDDLNFNIVYPTVWNWGWTLYPSKVAEKVTGRAVDPEPGLQGRDMLKEVVEEGHKRGLTVIPWFEFGFMAPADSELAKRHPEWLTKRGDGTQIWKEGIHERVWLSPFRPDVQNFMENLIVEIVKNYNIDGIQFDDHFGLPSEFGYDEYAVKLYKQEHNGKAPPKNPLDAKWVKWRADKITNYMQRVFKAIKKAKKGCLVSMSPNPQRFSYEFFLADWERWERMGLIEELVLQLYRNDMRIFISELERPEVEAARKHIPVSIGILTGLKGKFVPLQQIQAQVKNVRDRNFAGVSFFFYESLWNISTEQPQDRQRGFKRIFAKPMRHPNLIRRGVGTTIRN